MTDNLVFGGVGTLKDDTKSSDLRVEMLPLEAWSVQEKWGKMRRTKVAW
jgi:hypothetical protein